MLRTLALALLGLPTLAHADPQTIERELADLALPPTTDHGWHVAAFAQLASGSTTGVAESTLGAGGEVRYAADRCDYLRVGGQARLGWHGGAHTSAEQWASVCLPISVMELGHHLEWDVRPSLLAPLAMRAGTNRRETIAFHWQPLRMSLAGLLDATARGEAAKEHLPEPPPMTDAERAAIPHGDAIVFDVRVEDEILFGPMQPLATRIRAEAIPFGYLRHHVAPWGEARDFSVAIGQGGGEFVDRGAAIRLWGLRLENLQLGPVYATGGIGIASAGAGDFVMTDTGLERALNVTTPRAELGLEVGDARAHGHVRATHDTSVVADGYLTIDSRIATGLVIPLGDTRLALDGALALTDVRVPGASAIKAATGGGSLAIAHHLSGSFDASLQLDVARSFYAANVARLDFTPRWGVDAFAGVQARIGR